MLDIRWIRDNPEALERALTNRGWTPDANFIEQFPPDIQPGIEGAFGPDLRRRRSVEAILKTDEYRRAQIVLTQNNQQRRNVASKEIGQAKAQKDEARALALTSEVTNLKQALKEAEDVEQKLTKCLEEVLARVPNVPLDDVPVGLDDHANIEVRKWGDPRRVNWAREHFDLGEALGQMDFETAAKLSGSRFVVLKKELARMERALGQFMLDLHTTEHGYAEVQPPLLVKDEAMRGTGQHPKFGADSFFGTSLASRTEQAKRAISEFWTSDDTLALAKGTRMPADVIATVFERAPTSEDLWLIPTSEVSLTNLVRESILSEEEFPLRLTALTPCFRSEAGSAGKDTRGMLRQHQFDKVELVSITTPEKSLEEHERMTTCAEEVLRQLDLAYRVMALSTGDMGFSSQKTYDLEVWLPGQKAFREISSCSVCGDFQARRMQARFRRKDEKQPRFVHTLNGSGVAVGRALIAVMETYQNEDGSITVPDVLRPYMGGMEKIGG